MSAPRVFVVGVGMTKFEKPGKRDWDYPEMAKVAIKNALEDAKIGYQEVEQVFASYCYGDSTCGQRAVYEAGLTGIPVVNVNNNCSSGSSALFLARNSVRGRVVDCCLVLGFEKMEKGSLKAKWDDRTNPMDRHMTVMMTEQGYEPTAPPTPQLFGNAGREHMRLYGTKAETFAKIAKKNHDHSKNNPYAQFRTVYSLDEILASPKVFDPLTKLQCCPTSDGAAAVIVASEAFVRAHGLEGQAVEIAGMAMTTDTDSTFQKSMIDLVGGDMTYRAAQKAYKEANIGPQQVQAVELHDCFSANELITYEALGLCAKGQAEKLVESGDLTYGGKGPVVNPSGGLIAKGHALGASGLAQCAELSWQLRRMCGPRQVPNVKYALQHNVGLGGACVVGVYKLGFPEKVAAVVPSNKRNPALEVDPSEPTHKKDSIVVASTGSKL